MGMTAGMFLFPPDLATGPRVPGPLNFGFSSITIHKPTLYQCGLSVGLFSADRRLSSLPRGRGGTCTTHRCSDRSVAAREDGARSEQDGRGRSGQ